MPKRFLVVAFLLVLCSSAFAISAQEAINFATKQNNFLYSGESAEIFPNVRIREKGRYYWVVTALSGDSFAGFIPVLDDESPVLPDSPISRRELIKTAYVLRSERELYESSARQGLWLFDAANVKFFSDLEQDLKNEKIDLTTVKTSLGGFPALQSDVDDLQSMLDGMYPLSGDVSESLLEAVSFENSFLAGPDTNRLGEFEEKFLDCFGLVGELERERTAYLASLDELRQAIALTDLAIETKQGLNSLANIPSRLQQFSSKASLAVDLEENMASIFDASLANADSLAADLLTREKRNSAFQALYGGNREILEKTGRASLAQLMELLLSDDYYFLWENQADLGEAKENWSKAQDFYNNGSFEQAELSAEKAEEAALSVYVDGLAEQSNGSWQQIGFLLVVVLAVALVAIFVLRNRERIFGAFSSEGEEVELHDWES